ncbi:sodium ion-translocating decarboxylase subunit beta [Fusibacter sp. 3D3]|uniref:sodium ion-translocating decarboxylase subunit beta n=1 Tax=Fusibacter sp. 3D3 TaxID=1048380 RepID=UPI000852BFB9|nr:sodium ion-translocating decarboxylase subunit beta [Fusibacter sp. 3D3]GAU79629.1 hypothetical protein F3D3_4293 [Fusibacter sp. 3D3]
MKKWMKVVTVISGVFGTLLLMSNWLLKLVLLGAMHADVSKHEAGSIGIIGGADGPTAIFIGTKSPEIVKYIIVVILYTITAIGIIKWRKGKE